MALYDWITTPFKDATATPATVATHDDEKLSTVAKVATVAVASLEDTNQIVITDPTQTYDDLIDLHPPLVLGFKLIDVLMHADTIDYEDLRNPEVLKIFALGLLNARKINN